MMLPAGGVEFFQAVLERRLGRRRAATAGPRLRRPALLVCGSPQAWGQDRMAQCRRHGIPALVMPDALRTDAAPPPAVMRDWAGEVARAVEARGCTMVAIGRGDGDATLTHSGRLAERLAQAVAGAVGRAPVATLCLEGGATAGALLRAFGWGRLAALPSPDLPGVAALRAPAGAGAVDGAEILVKPGSYPWPERLWRALGAEGTG
jgi:hypothetical protein